MEPAFCPKTRQLVIECAQKLGIHVEKKGTAVVIEGPRFSTLAESNVYRSWNADLVNMTLAPEVSYLMRYLLVPRYLILISYGFIVRLCWLKKSVFVTLAWLWQPITTVGTTKLKK